MNKLTAEIKLGQSKKTGKEYVMVEIPLTDNYKKVVFLDPAEQALVKMSYNK